MAAERTASEISAGFAPGCVEADPLGCAAVMSSKTKSAKRSTAPITERTIIRHRSTAPLPEPPASLPPPQLFSLIRVRQVCTPVPPTR